jgi:hypothetical protein
MGEKLTAGTIISAIAARLKGVTGGKKEQTAIASADPKTALYKPAGNSPRPGVTAIPLAIDIGWTMAVLFGQTKPASVNDRPPVTDRLPTEHELAPAARINLEVVRVNALLVRLDALLPPSPDPKRKRPAIQLKSGSEEKTLSDANLDILEWLACAGRQYSVAYQLGRSLRDTAAPPARAGAAQDALLTQLSRGKGVQAPGMAFHSGAVPTRLNRGRRQRVDRAVVRSRFDGLLEQHAGKAAPIGGDGHR